MMKTGANRWNKSDKDKYVWNKIKRFDNSECWIWTGTLHRRGFGYFHYGRKLYCAHRCAWEIHNNKALEKDQFVIQRCGNILCCNPDHLTIMTRSEWKIEEIKKRTHYPLKLEVADIFEIRRLFMGVKRNKNKLANKLAEKYGVSPGHIINIANRNFWKWLPDPP